MSDAFRQPPSDTKRVYWRPVPPISETPHSRSLKFPS